MNNQLEEMTTNLNKYDIDYWIDSGTLLGIIREEKLLKSDPDIDISLFAKDLDKLNHLLTEENHNYNIQYKIFDRKKVVCKLIPESDTNRVVGINIFRKCKKDDENFAWCPAVMVENPVNKDSHIYDLIEFGRKIIKKINKTKTGEIHIDSYLLKPIVTIGTWWIPMRYISNRTTYKDTQMQIPETPRKYLEYRFGKWKTPEPDWNYWYDDNSIFHKHPYEMCEKI